MLSFRLSLVLKSSHQVEEESTDSAQTSSDLETCGLKSTSDPTDQPVEPTTDPTQNLEHFETEMSLSRLDLNGDPVPQIVVETICHESSSPKSGTRFADDLDRIEVESECDSTSSKLGLDGVSCLSGNSSLRSSGSDYTGLPVPYNTEDRYTSRDREF